MMITYAQYIKTYKGKKIDVDKVYGCQCVDNAKAFSVLVCGVQRKYTDSWGNAIQWYTEFNNKSYLKNYFNRIPYKKGVKIKKGDLFVFKTKSGNGHIGVCTGKYDDNGFYAYDTNHYGKHDPLTLRKFAYTNLQGFLRPKNQTYINPKPTFAKGDVVEILHSRNIYKNYETREVYPINEITKFKCSQKAVAKVGSKWTIESCDSKHNVIKVIIGGHEAYMFYYDTRVNIKKV